MSATDQAIADMIDADPGAPPMPPIVDLAEIGVDELSLNGAGRSAQPAAEPAEEIAIVTAQDFAAVSEPGADPLLGTNGEAVIPQGGDVMLYGDGGASKTTLSIDLACHLAAGDAWLGLPVPKPVRVLLIEAEGPRPLFRQKLGAKLQAWEGSDLSDRLLVFERPWADFAFPDAEQVAARIAGQEIDVLIVGPLTRVGMEDLGTLQQVRDFIAQVDRFRAQTRRRLTVFLVHHQNKGGSVSGAWEGAVDTLIHAQVHGPGKTTLTFQKARWASAWHKRVLELDWTSGEGFALVEDPARDLLADVEAWLRDNPHSTVKEIATKKVVSRPDGTKETIPGVAAKESAVTEILNGSTVFRVRTDEEAKEVGRHPTARVWEVVGEGAPEQRAHLGAPTPARAGGDGGAPGAPPLREGAPQRSTSTPGGEVQQVSRRTSAHVDCPSHAEPVAGCRYCRGAT